MMGAYICQYYANTEKSCAEIQMENVLRDIATFRH